MDSEDDVPLSFLKKNLVSDVSINNVTSPINLFKHSIVQCEFCDRTFNNWYNYLIHNAKHIIIPLINQNVHQCPECVDYFTSIRNLNCHILEKHPLNNTNGIILGNSKKEKIIKNILEKQPVIQLEKINIEPLLENNLNKIPLDNPESRSNNETPIEMEVPLSLVWNGYNGTPEGDVSERLQNGVNRPPERKGIGNRIVFEEDDMLKLNTNGLLNDLITDCRVNLNVYDVPWWKNVVSPLHKTEFEGSFEISTNDNVFQMNVEPVYTKCVHYSELMKPGFYRCRKCGISFPNRYKAIVHETKHLKIHRRKPRLCIICEKLVGCSKRLKRHYKEMHPGQKPKKKHISKCRKCGLPYSNYSKHISIYHQVYRCSVCGKGFLTTQENSKHFNEHLEIKKCPKCDYKAQSMEVDYHMELVHNYVKSGEMNICDMCLEFLTKRPPFWYVVVGEVCEIGVRRQCEKCSKLSFVLKTVQRFRRVLPRADVNEVKSVATKPLSNQTRLKNIQNRLKMLKLKSYIFVSFLLRCRSFFIYRYAGKQTECSGGR